MKAEVESAECILVDVPQCEACCKCMEESELVDEVMSVDWRNVRCI